jgi:hypothetical protein
LSPLYDAGTWGEKMGKIFSPKMYFITEKIYFCENFFPHLFSPGASIGKWTQTLDLGKKRRVFYRCATLLAMKPMSFITISTPLPFTLSWYLWQIVDSNPIPGNTN